MSVSPFPDGYHTVTPYLVLRNAAAAVDFYQRAFGATEALRLEAPGGDILHCEVRIGNSVVLLADEAPDSGYVGPQTRGGATGSLLLYVPDVDDVFAHAIECGARALSAVHTQFHGDRTGTIEDPFGHVWTIATHVEDVTHDEMQTRLRQQ